MDIVIKRQGKRTPLFSIWFEREDYSDKRKWNKYNPEIQYLYVLGYAFGRVEYTVDLINLFHFLLVVKGTHRKRGETYGE